MLNYELTVEDISKDGHPILELFSCFERACERYDDYVKKYPYNKVILSKLIKKDIKESTPIIKPIPKQCPKGHEFKISKTSGPSIVKAYNLWYCKDYNSFWYCGICGTFFQSKV